jgi:hypothetical protein
LDVRKRRMFLKGQICHQACRTEYWQALVDAMNFNQYIGLRRKWSGHSHSGQMTCFHKQKRSSKTRWNGVPTQQFHFIHDLLAEYRAVSRSNQPTFLTLSQVDASHRDEVLTAVRSRPNCWEQLSTRSREILVWRPTNRSTGAAR